MKTIAVYGAFDDLRSRHIRFLEEAAKLGDLHVLLWDDEAVRAATGKPPKFPQEERRYLLQAIRYVEKVTIAAAAPTSPARVEIETTGFEASAGQVGEERNRLKPRVQSGEPRFSGQFDPDVLPAVEDLRPDVWVVGEADDTAAKRAFCAAHGLEYRILTAAEMVGFPGLQLATADRRPPTDLPPNPLPAREGAPDSPIPAREGAPDSPLAWQERGAGGVRSSVVRPSSRKKVVVTGCYDWFHSGHVRFFEEVSELGDLYVVLGHDANVRFLKGEGHPMIPQDERRYVVQACRYVTQALITSGWGWMDAEPEIAALKPDIYAVNEDGDRPEKRAFCQEHGLEYVVLKRTPKAGLPKRASTDLRGF